MPCATLEKAVEQLYYWQNGVAAGEEPDNFTAIIFRLFQKADPGNRAALRSAFPHEYAAWDEWYRSPTQDAFFLKYGFPKRALEGGEP